MSIFEIVLISIGLAMDAFGVSIGKGLTMPVGENSRKVTLAFLFGLFQFLMPLIGWLIGRQFIAVISVLVVFVFAFFVMLFAYFNWVVKERNQFIKCIKMGYPDLITKFEFL